MQRKHGFNACWPCLPRLGKHPPIKRHLLLLAEAHVERHHAVVQGQPALHQLVLGEAEDGPVGPARYTGQQVGRWNHVTAVSVKQNMGQSRLQATRQQVVTAGRFISRQAVALGTRAVPGGALAAPALTGSG